VGARVLVEWVAGGLVAGQLLLAGGRITGAAIGLSGAALLVACLGCALVDRYRVRGVVGAAAVAAALVGAALAARASAIPDDPDHVARLALPMRARVVGRVVGRPMVDARRTLVSLDVVAVGSNTRVRGRVRLRVRGPAHLERGELVAVETTLRRPRNFENPGRFDVVSLLVRQGIHVVASVWDADRIGRLGTSATSRSARAVDAWRDMVREVIATLPNPEVAAVLSALVLGDESRIPPDLRTAFTRAGVVHVLSVSGLHVGIVTAAAAGVLALLLGRSELVLLYLDRRKLAVMGGLAAAMLYGALTGFAVATLRSVLMAGVVALAVLLDRLVDPMRALALAAIVVSVTQPGAPADISFQLSFVSVAALLLGARADGRDAGYWRFLRRAGRAAAAASIGTAPLTAFHFHQVSLVSPIANPVVVPLFEGASVLPALAGAVVAPFAPSVAAMAFVAAALPVRAAVALVRAVGTWRWAALDVPFPNLGELGLLYGAIAGAWYRRTGAGRWVGAVCLLGLTLDAAWWTGARMASGGRATFLDVGQGDAAVVELVGGRVVVIDAGGFPGSDFDTGAAIVEPFLRTRKIQRVDVVVMSHAHPDHAGGLAHLVRRLAPSELWWSGLGGSGSAWDEILAALRETGTPVRLLRAGDTITDYPEIDVVHPPAAWTTASLNEGSLVIRVRVGHAAMLFTGDAERDAEAAMLMRPDRLGAAVLKVPHHGSRTSSSWPFVTTVDPAVAVMSLGVDNRFGHPAPDVEARYARRGVAVYRTDGCGAITIVPDGDGLRIRPSNPSCAAGVAIRTPPPP
jgi:competence protein ComEC